MGWGTGNGAVAGAAFGVMQGSAMRWWGRLHSAVNAGSASTYPSNGQGYSHDIYPEHGAPPHHPPGTLSPGCPFPAQLGARGGSSLIKLGKQQSPVTMRGSRGRAVPPPVRGDPCGAGLSSSVTESHPNPLGSCPVRMLRHTDTSQTGLPRQTDSPETPKNNLKV